MSLGSENRRSLRFSPGVAPGTLQRPLPLAGETGQQASAESLPRRAPERAPPPPLGVSRPGAAGREASRPRGASGCGRAEVGSPGTCQWETNCGHLPGAPGHRSSEAGGHGDSAEDASVDTQKGGTRHSHPEF